VNKIEQLKAQLLACIDDRYCDAMNRDPEDLLNQLIQVVADETKRIEANRCAYCRCSPCKCWQREGGLE